MKRRIKALKIMISDFYKENRKDIRIIVLSIFITTGITFAGTSVNKFLKQKEVTKAEIEYCEEKIEEIINTDLKSISDKTIKELKKEGYTINIDVTNKKITIGFKEKIKGKIIFSYSKEILYASANDYQELTIFVAICLGAGCGILVFFLCLGVIKFTIKIKKFFNVQNSKIRDNYKEAIKKADEQKETDPESEEVEESKESEKQSVKEKESNEN